ncbi:GCG_CRPN prefix-to-repeats domain-containing protein [Methylobacterium sp. Leaf106]|uniref:GCG_CRPN prefix-to-repeats domain-containing protein n=1 Tax=Methylobacterium sp. Leaf106 TaxID=1736255 RepID=UPI0009E7A7D5
MASGKPGTVHIIGGFATLLVAGGAQALPAPAGGIALDAPIVQVRGGCGFGAHRNPFGGCRLNRGRSGAVRRAMTGAPGGCPPRLYRGPGGRCRP